jgi:hypothetical protein
MNSRARIAASILVLAGTASAIAMASMVSASLAQGTTTQSGNPPGSPRQDGTPMERYKDASKAAAVTLKGALAECREMNKAARSGCARSAREQQRVDVAQANARIKLEIASSRGPGQSERN